MRAPPTTGPIAPPKEKLDTQTLTANVFSLSSRNMLLMRERVDGAIVAPAIPSSARAKMSICAVRENAARRETTANVAEPIKRSFRRPMRSPSVPIIRSAPAARNP
jgi:hypothetical protein